VREVKEFEEEVLELARVTRVVKGGRRMRFRATVVIGNRNGKVGVGVGKSDEVVGSIQKAISDAKKNLIVVKMDGTTIPHDVAIKYKSASILIMPAAPGTGIIAGGTIRKVVELAGIKDILSKSFGTTNKISCSRATLEALSLLKENPYMQRSAARSAAIRAKQAQQTAKPSSPKPTSPAARGEGGVPAPAAKPPKAAEPPSPAAKPVSAPAKTQEQPKK
jgi:small subunit ribosomal protein S5